MIGITDSSCNHNNQEERSLHIKNVPMHKPISTDGHLIKLKQKQDIRLCHVRSMAK